MPLRLRRFTLLVAIAAAAPLTACASGGRSGAVPRRSADVITQEEIEAATGVANAYELVQRLRPSFLVSRGRTSIQDPTAGEIVVYFDNTRMGGLGALRGINTSSIREIRRLSAGDATGRFGTGHTGGAIVVTLK